MSKVLIFITLAIFMATLAYESDAALFFYNVKPHASLKPSYVSFLICYVGINVNDEFLTLGREGSSRWDYKERTKSVLPLHLPKKNYLPLQTMENYLLSKHMVRVLEQSIRMMMMEHYFEFSLFSLCTFEINEAFGWNKNIELIGKC